MEGSMERIPKRRDTGVKKVKKKRTLSRTEERKAVKIGRILQSYGHTQKDETKEQRDGWNSI
jgi:hypothetical protein